MLFPYNPAEERKRYDLIEAAVARARLEVPELEILQARGVPRARMPLYMNAADVLVLASLFEGSPNAVKEAMAVNLPVVTVDVGDTADLIGPTEGCYLVPRDAEAIAARIVVVCRRGTRTNGREWIARLAMEKIAQQVAERLPQCGSQLVGHYCGRRGGKRNSLSGYPSVHKEARICTCWTS